MNFTAGLLLLVPIVGILVIVGFVFSIVGIAQANRGGLKKYPGVWGIVFCVLTVVSPFVLMAVALMVG